MQELRGIYEYLSGVCYQWLLGPKSWVANLDKGVLLRRGFVQDGFVLVGYFVREESPTVGVDAERYAV